MTGEPETDKPRNKRGREKEASSLAAAELVILTGLSGSGKLSALKAFEDLGYYSVANLPLELVPRFADLVRQRRCAGEALFGDAPASSAGPERDGGKIGPR